MAFSRIFTINHHHRQPLAPLALTAVSAFMLAGCLGGGGSSPGTGVAEIVEAPAETPVTVTPPVAPVETPVTPVETPAPPAAYTRTADFSSHWGLEASGAESAYQQGYSGAGVTVAVFDDGIAGAAPELSGRVDTGFNAASYESDGSPVVRHDCALGEDCDTGAHGTFVGGVIAAAGDGTGAHGVAPGARLFAVNIDTGANDGAFLEQQMLDARAWAAAIASGARIFNHSYGHTPIDPETSGFENTLSASIAAERLREARDAGVVNVYATGNDGVDEPGPLALMPYWFDDLRDGSVLAVTAVVDDEGALRRASYANRCGSARDWCLAAPAGDASAGVGFTAVAPMDDEGIYHQGFDPDQDGYYLTTGGTSGATAFASGALALLAEAFPYMSGGQLGQILLDTAQDIGEAGVDAEFGHGLLDIETAMQPVGETVLVTGPDLSTGTATALSGSGLSTGRVAGLDAGLEGLSTVFFDRYGRAFPVVASALVRQSPSLGNSLRTASRIVQGMGRATLSPEDGALMFAVRGDDGGWTHGVAASRTLDLGGGAALSLAHETDGAAGGIASAAALLNQSDTGHFAALYHEAFGGGFLALMPDESAAALSQRIGEDITLALTVGASSPESGAAAHASRSTAELAWRLSDRTRLGAMAGLVSERGSALGMRGTGPLAFHSDTDTAFFELTATHDLTPRFSLVGSVGWGRITDAGSSAYLGLGDDVQLATATVGVAGRDMLRAGDRLGLSFGAPLHPVAGTLRFTAPVGRTADGGIIHETTPSRLGGYTPLALKTHYATPLGEHAVLALNGSLQNIASSDRTIDLGLSIGLQW